MAELEKPAGRSVSAANISSEEAKALLSLGYKAVAADIGDAITRIHDGGTANAQLVFKDLLNLDGDSLDRIVREVLPADINKFAEVMLRMNLFYYANEGFYWIEKAGFPKTRKASKNEITGRLFGDVKLAVGISSKDEYSDYFWLIATALIQYAAVSDARGGCDYLVRDMVYFATDHIVRELHAKPPEGSKTTLADLMKNEFLDEEGKKLLKELDTKSFGEICKMCLSLLIQIDAQNRFSAYILELSAKTLETLAKRDIEVTGNEKDYDRQVVVAELKVLSGAKAVGEEPLLKKLILEAAQNMESPEEHRISENTRREIDRIMRQGAESERRHVNPTQEEKEALERMLKEAVEK